jgi:hypothetical protein
VELPAASKTGNIIISEAISEKCSMRSASNHSLMTAKINSVFRYGFLFFLRNVQLMWINYINVEC